MSRVVRMWALSEIAAQEYAGLFGRNLDPGSSRISVGIRWRIVPGLTWGVMAQQVVVGNRGALLAHDSELKGSVEAKIGRDLALSVLGTLSEVGRQKGAVDAMGRSVYSTESQHLAGGRLTVDFMPSDAVRLRSRCDVRVIRNTVGQRPEHGVALMHGLRWSPQPWITLDVGVGSFETESPGVRLFAWEPGVRGSLVQTPMVGSGFRWRAKIRISAPWISGELLYGELNRSDSPEDGSRPPVRELSRQQCMFQIECAW